LKRAVFSVYTDVFMMKTYSELRRTVARLWRNGCTTYTRVVAPQKRNYFCLSQRKRRTTSARMRVPKMVKNGFNSGLPVSPVFEEDKNPQRNQELTRSPKPSLDREGRIKTILGQFRNKHARYRNRKSWAFNDDLLRLLSCLRAQRFSSSFAHSCPI
jgi:hypothetical protein